MKFLAFLVLGVAAFFAIDWLGAQSVADAPLALWPWQDPGATTRALFGAAAFGFVAVILGTILVLAFRPRRRRRRYPSSLGELDEYTGFISRD